MKQLHLHRSFPHVDIDLTITIRRGQPGFAYEARGRNRLADVPAAFNFNLPLAIHGVDDLDQLEIRWRGGGWSLRRQPESAFWIGGPSTVLVRNGRWAVHIRSTPAETAGFFVDWSTNYLTPDVHGCYRPRKLNETVTTHWQLMAHPDG